MIKTLVKKVLGVEKMSYDGSEIDFGKNFAVITYYDLLKKYAGLKKPESVSLPEISRFAKDAGIKVEKGDGVEKIMDGIYKKTCRPKIIQPTFIIDYPVNMLPLAKRSSKDPNVVDAFQLLAGGIEILKAFAELNDPIDQRERFEKQELDRKAGDVEAQAYDHDFVEALEYGMPPACGVGIGIDRLVMFLTNTKNIKEVIFFPTMRPKQ